MNSSFNDSKKEKRKMFKDMVLTTYVDLFDIFIDGWSEEIGYWDHIWFDISAKF